MHITSSVYFHDASSMPELDAESVELVVTSPPYPMIEMWDGTFSEWNTSISDAMEKDQPEKAFDLMHQALAVVWQECYRVLTDGGMMCINIGDATRSINGSFRLYQNHARTVEACLEVGFEPLPGILWRKTTNKPTSFMGSGMLAPNAYVTLEHEHILIFRKGGKRSVSSKKRDQRYESAFFWEERNTWFSDIWTGLVGTSQSLDDSSDSLRKRSAAYPLEVPLRLIHMFSIYGDTVLDPFWGTGTTSLAASLLKRNAIGYELDRGLWTSYEQNSQNLPDLSSSYCAQRLRDHKLFVDACDEEPSYRNKWYDVPVITRQEKLIRLYRLTDIERPNAQEFRFSYQPFEE